MNEKNFAELFRQVRDASLANVPGVQQDHVRENMIDLVTNGPATTEPVVLLGYHVSGDGGGGVFTYDSGLAKSNHDGGRVIDADVTFAVAGDYASFITAPGSGGNGCWVRQADAWAPEMWGAKGDGTADDSEAWNHFATFLCANGGKGILKGTYLVDDAAETEIDTDATVEIEGLSDSVEINGGSGDVTLFELTRGGLTVRNVNLVNLALFFTDKPTTQSFDHVILENVSFDNTGQEIHSAALRLKKSGSTVPTLGLFRAVNVQVEGGLGGIEIESAIERFHVNDYVCRNISVPDDASHFSGDDMRNLGYASGLSLGFDDPEFVGLTGHGHIGSVLVEGVQDDREQVSTGNIANVDGVRIHAFDVRFDSIHVRDVDSFSKVDCTALYLKAHRCRGDRFTAIDAGFHEGMLTLKGARRANPTTTSPGFNVSINDVQLIGTQEGFSGRAGVFCGVDDVHIGRLYMENVGGAVEDPYASGSRLTGQGQLFQAAAPDATAMQRLSVGRIEVINCDLGNESGSDIRAVELKGYREIQIGRIVFDGVSNSGGFGASTERLVLVGIVCDDAPISHCDIGGILERNTQLSGTQTETTMLEIDSRTAGFGQLVLREAFVTSSVFDIGIKTLGTASIDLLDIAGGDLTEIGSSLLDTSAREPGEIRIRGVRGLADLPAPDANDPVVSSFTGDGTETDFTLSAEPVSEAAVLVSVDGVVQHQSAYSVTGTTLGFTTAPANGAAIEVRDFSLTAIADPEAVATVANIASEVQTVAGIDTEITAVAADAADIGVVGAAIADVSTVAADIADVTTAADNLAAIQAAPAAATSAASSASAAAASASTAETAAEAAAAAALTDARIVTAQARFQNRFGKLPPSVLGLDLGEMSQVDLTRATIGFRNTAGGGLESVSADTARLTHDPETGEPLGLLLEPEQTNQMIHSDLQAGGTGVINTADNAVGPDGKTTARTIFQTAANSGHFIGNAFNTSGIASGTRYLLAMFVKDAGTVATQHAHYAYSAPFDRPGANYFGWRWDFATETMTPFKVGSSDVTVGYRRLANGWYLLWATTVAVASGTTGFVTQYTDGIGGAVTFAGNTNAGMAVKGCLCIPVNSADALPPTRIDTDGSQVTRAPDLATVDLTAIPAFRPDGFSVLIEAEIRDSDGVLLAVGTGSSEEIALEMQAGDLHLTGTDSLDLTAASGMSPGDRIVVALRVAENDVAVSVGGTTVVTDSSHTMLGTSDKMQLGSDIEGANGIPCTIRQVAFFGPLDDTSLEAMSGS